MLRGTQTTRSLIFSPGADMALVQKLRSTSQWRCRSVLKMQDSISFDQLLKALCITTTQLSLMLRWLSYLMERTPKGSSGVYIYAFASLTLALTYLCLNKCNLQHAILRSPHSARSTSIQIYLFEKSLKGI